MVKLVLTYCDYNLKMNSHKPLLLG